MLKSKSTVAQRWFVHFAKSCSLCRPADENEQGHETVSTCGSAGDNVLVSSKTGGKHFGVPCPGD